MSRIRRMRARFWRPRYTIGGLMAVIAGIALVLTVLRLLAPTLRATYPEFAAIANDWATPQTGMLLGFLAVGGFAALRLMRMDETA